MKERELYVFGYPNKTEVSLNHPDDKVRQEASDFVSLMTPVVKSLFTDLGMENNKMMQCKFMEDMVIQKTKELNNCIEIIELHQFYEGTNSVQAADLVFRKIIK